MTLFRDQTGLLVESMKTVQDFKTKQDLVDYLQKDLGKYGFKLTRASVVVSKYCYDKRIDWDTFIVTIGGYGVAGFTNGDFTEPNHVNDPEKTK